MTIDLIELETDESPELEKDADYRNEYLFCKPLNIHLMSASGEIDAAVRFLLQEIGYTRSQRDKEYKTMRMLVCNLYRNYNSVPARYLRTYLSKNGVMKLQRRYNKLEINVRPLRRCVAGLTQKEYIEYKKGYFNKKFRDGYQTRIRATEKLSLLLDDAYKVQVPMIFENPNQELVIRKTKPKTRPVTYKKKDGSTREYKVKVKRLDDYVDGEFTRRWRSFLVRYNELLQNTYIDIDLKRYSPDPDNPIYIELFDKTVRRIFSHGVFEKGGRFYGGFWQQLPEVLRDRIILNGQHIVEIDFSGMMVHILYAFVGKKLGVREPYVVAKNVSPEQDKLRELYKKLLVAGCNAEGTRLSNGRKKAIMSIRDHVRKNPDKYPVVPEDDKECYAFLRDRMDELRKYHPEIEHFLGSGEGIRTQRVDSDIAYKLLVQMTKRKVPVLCIHDSFVCRISDKEIVFPALKQAYVDVINSLLLEKKHSLRVTEQDVFTKETSVIMKLPKYLTANRDRYDHVFNVLWSDNEQYDRQRTWKRTGCSQFYDTIIA